MKLAIQTLAGFMQHVGKDLTLAGLYQKAADAGFEGLSVCSWEVERCGFETVYAAMDKAKMPLSSYICFSPVFAMDDATLRQSVQIAAEGLDICKRLHGDTMMLVPISGVDQNGMPTAVPAQWDRTEMQDRMLLALKEILPIAAEKGIRLSVENDPHIAVPQCRIAELDRLFEGAPELHFTLDTANMLAADEAPLSYLEHFASRICCAHLKDAVLTGENGPGDLTVTGNHMKMVRHGTGVIDWPAMLARLKSLNVPWLEYESDVPYDCWAEDVAYLRSIMQ